MCWSRHSDRGQVYICAYVHLQITGSDLHCSPRCNLAPHKSLQGYTNTTGEIHTSSEPSLYLPDSDNVHKIQLHRNSVACMSNFANFIIIIQTNTGISTFSSLTLFYLLSWILHLVFLFSLFHHIWLFPVGVHGDTLPSVHNACPNFQISKMGSGILRSIPCVTDIIAY